MTEIEKQIEELGMQLQEMRNRQLQMNREMLLAEQKLQMIKAHFTADTISEEVKQDNEYLQEEIPVFEQPKPYIQQVREKIQNGPGKSLAELKKSNHELEDFIGTNLISKIGILVTIIGVFIGAKYAIDNELISPAMRIVAGYAAGIVLALFSLKLKEKYLYFSSILIGGGLSVIYFITYIAFNYYALFPQWLAFAFMVITTIAAVVTALWYNQKIIALLGQVAAYAIPFLLSDGKGNVFVLFGYVSLINVGLLILSLKKDWKILYHIAFFLTWLIYSFWVLEANQINKNFIGGIIFLAITFFTFYATFLSYKIIKKEQYQLGEIGILLFNALFFFFLGASLINDAFTSVHFLTYFTIANAAIHFVAGYFIYRARLADDTVFQFISGLGLLFVTIAIPIELDGSWVTLLWTVEGLILFYIACKNNRQLYLDIAVPLVIVSVVSLLQDWYMAYPFLYNNSDPVAYTKLPFLNINFFISLFVVASLGYMTYAFEKSKLVSKKIMGVQFFLKLIPVAFLVLCYFALYNEIHLLWDQKIALSQKVSNTEFENTQLLFQSLTLLIYSFIFFASWLIINKSRIKSERLHELLIVLSLIVNIVFLFQGLGLIGELRDAYLSKAVIEPSRWLLFVRYVTFAAAALLWISVLKTLNTFPPSATFRKLISVVFNVTLLSVISNEFIHWMDLAGYQNQYKLGLSLICGAYALTLLFVGILKSKKHLRMFAIVLFGITLLKLFFYDLSSLSTISKTIVLVLLGILLLFASFLYNKYKDLLFGKEDR
jgi:uncharacterized membrane protein